ncbi:MAG TPA: DUF6541 family protein [Anaerolineae bacterium]|nr:DUF6541 family protein [Anaerolineae bacterium]
MRRPSWTDGRRAWRWLRRRLDSNALLIVALSLFAWAPLVGPPYFLDAHDAPHSIFFLNQFDQAIRDGVLYPRWGVDFALGYGYPLFNIYSTLAFYVAEVFVLLGASLTAAVKLTYIAGFMISGLTMYAFAKRVLSPQAGLVAGAIYMFAPYRLLDIYVRSAFAEFCAFSFMPLVLLLFHGLAHHRSWRRFGLAGLAYAALFLTHAATALLFTILLIPYVAFLALGEVRRGWSSVVRLVGIYVGAAAFAVALAAIFLLPMIAEKGYIVEGQWTQGSFEYAKHFVYPSQLFSSFWGYGYAGEGLADEMSLQLGLAAVTLALIGAIYSLGRLVAGWPHVAFFLAATLVVVGAMMPAAQPLWGALPLAGFVQFPWRLLGLVALTISVLSGAAVQGLAEGGSSGAQGLDARVAVLALIVVLASYGYTLPQYTAPSARSEQSVAIIDFETFYPPDRVGMTAWAEEQPQDSPLVEQYLSGEPLIKAAGLAEGMQVQMIKHSASREEVEVTSPRGGELRFYTYYFPGWRGYVDGREVEIYPGGRHGLITLQVPPGEHRVSIRFGDTPVRTAGKLVTVASLVLAAVILAWPWARPARST